MARGRIKKILLPYLVRQSLFGMVVASLLFILFLMLRLVTTLIHEISRMSENQHQLTTEQVLYYIKNLLMYVLFGSLQLFGLYGLARSNRNILVAFGSSLLVAFCFSIIDHLLSSGYLHIAIYLLVQSAFVFVYLAVFPSKRRPISHIHYIPMPNEDMGSPQQVSSGTSLLHHCAALLLPMRFVHINRQWLIAHEYLIQVSLIFLQLQKVILTVIWYSEHSRYLTRISSGNGSLCRNASNGPSGDYQFALSGLVPWTYIFLSLFGIIAVIVKNAILMGSFLALDLIFGFLMYMVKFLDTLFVPLFTGLSVLFTSAYLLVLQQSNRHRPIAYGPSKAIRSPDSTTAASTNTTERSG